MYQRGVYGFMSRTLTPISNKQIKYYEEKIKSAYLQNDKKNVRRYKRLFSVYIKKRGLDISFFKNHKIYKYFNKLSKIEQLRKKLETEKAKIDEEKVIKELIAYFDSDFGDSVRKYFSNKRNELDDKTIGEIEDYFNDFKKNTAIREIEYRIKQVENKNQYMREYRKFILTNLVVDDNKKTDKLLDELPNKIEIMLEEYNKIEEQLRKKEEQLNKFRDIILEKNKLYEVLNDLRKKEIYPCYFLVSLCLKGFTPDNHNNNKDEFLKLLDERLKNKDIDKKRYDDSVYFLNMIIDNNT
jgi:hypothetical protein